LKVEGRRSKVHPLDLVVRGALRRRYPGTDSRIRKDSSLLEKDVEVKGSTI